MNLNELSQKLEDHLTDQDIQDAQELLDSTHQEIVDMRGELVEAQAELSALRTAAIADAAENERLKAQNAELLAAQQWQPIESAPTKGYFKAWHGIWACEITVCFVADGTRSWLIEKTKATKWPVEAFTRWQPLPPPEIAKTGEKS